MNEDPDYAFKLERAIAEKYGEKTIVNPKGLWCPEKEKKYLQDLKALSTSAVSKERRRKEHNGFLVSEKLINLNKKKYCNVCGFYKPKIFNKMYFIKFDCCKTCFVKFVEFREKRWQDGWRPKGE